jgi:Fe-S cluster biogenesis protein NfuA
VDVHTGVLPKDRELTRLRGLVINRKRGATASDHRRFFDRLGELIVDYVRVGDGNFHLHGPVDMEWEEYRTKLGYSPAAHREFREFLVSRAVSPALARALVGLGVLHEGPDAHTLRQLEDIAAGRVPAPSAEAAAPLWGARPAGTSLAERVDHVVRTVVGPVLQNDGGKLDVLGVDEASGEISVRFVGSCANCPYSLLSMEQIVKPSLLAIQGVSRVVHRARMRRSELTEACAREPA